MQGKSLGPYRVVSELGSGGMGKVWLATRGEDRFALKVVHPHLLESPGFFKRFLREAEIGKAVAHPNVVRCFDCDQLVVDGTAHAFLVMEYVEGQTLRELLDELTTVPEELCRHVGREVARGLAAIHAAGVVHRDLKPENVLITPDHQVKVMDLGVARLADEALRLSLSGAFVGSPLYASPEHFGSAGEDLDGRADLFSLGVILYELSCGAHPHPGDDFATVLVRVREEKPRRLGERNPQLSPFFEEVVHTLLAKNREGRLASASKLLEVLTGGEQSTWWGRRARALRAETRRPLRRIRIPKETAVYGREDELARLRGLYGKARAGEGQVVLIEGEAGIGKTRLVDELIGRLRQDGEDLNFLFGSYPPGGAATAWGAWSTAYREQLGAEGLEETLTGCLRSTPVLVPAFAALLRGEPAPRGEETLTKDSLHTVFVHVTRALAEDRPTVVLIEDLHFAPEEGRALFASLALAVPEHRILLVGTARPGIPEDWRANLERLDQAGRMELQRLGPKDLTRLLIDAFQSERLAEELTFRIAEKSDGNPFFIFEIIRGLREGRYITRRPDGTWVGTRVIREIEIPSSVQDLIQARISDLDEEEQELLDVAACCGFEFDPGLVAEASGSARIPVLRKLAHLERDHRLVRSRGDRFAFDHHQVHEALYDALPAPLAREYHAAIGEALSARHPEPEAATAADLCEHFLKGGLGEKALPVLDAVLDRLEKSYLNEHAVTLADLALGMEDLLTGASRAEVLLRKAARLGLLGRAESERATLEEAVALAEAEDDPDLQCRARLAAGWNHMQHSRSEAARDEFTRARDLAREAEDRLGEAKATANLGLVLNRLARFDEALEHVERSLAITREIGDRRSEMSTTGNLGLVLLNMGRYEEARERFEHCLELARELGDRRSEGASTGNLGLVLWSLGRYEAARERCERHLAVAREIGDRRGEALATGNLGSVLFVQGLFEAAGDCYERKLAIVREIGDRREEGNAVGDLGIVLVSLGCYEEGREACRDHLAIAREIGDRRGEGSALMGLGILHLWLGDPEKAREHLDESVAILREIGARRQEGYAVHGLALLAEATGDAGEASRLCEKALALHRGTDHRTGVAEVLTTLGRIHLEAGRHEEAKASLTEALELGRDPENPATIVLASALLASLPGASPEGALASISDHEHHTDHSKRLEARYHLFRATGDPTHLEKAFGLLRELGDHAPEEYRETMVENVPLHREVMSAWEEHRAAS